VQKLDLYEEWVTSGCDRTSSGVVIGSHLASAVQVGVQPDSDIRRLSRRCMRGGWLVPYRRSAPTRETAGSRLL
jgi:hypothetical protein